MKRILFALLVLVGVMILPGCFFACCLPWAIPMEQIETASHIKYKITEVDPGCVYIVEYKNKGSLKAAKRYLERYFVLGEEVEVTKHKTRFTVARKKMGKTFGD